MIRIAWGELVAFTPADVTPYAARLAAAYNEPRNSALLGNTQLLSPEDVCDHYANLQPPDAYAFVLLQGGDLAGDGDLRGVANGAGELAFLIASPAAQGKGLGTRFAIMIQAFAFRHLALERVYAAVIPHNAASLRVFEKLGYVVDSSTAYGDEGDIVLRLDRATFEQRHADAQISIDTSG
jgi:RimJ/RimL family protein N-acetyltransferase